MTQESERAKIESEITELEGRLGYLRSRLREFEIADESAARDELIEMQRRASDDVYGRRLKFYGEE